MNRIGRTSTTVLRTLSTFAADSSKPTHEILKDHLKRNAVVPLIQNYRSTWPDVVHHPVDSPAVQLSPRTVSDEHLAFKMRASYTHGSDIFYPHMNINPADYKVSLFVNTRDLNLRPRELDVLIEMLGKRYNQGKREVKLVSEQFTNRVENKRYLIYLLEKLMAEARRLAAAESEINQKSLLSELSSPSHVST